MAKKRIKKVLVANRGEIACRIIRSCQELGVKTVAIYSTADEKALHKSMADETYCLGAAESSQSYLNQKKIIEAAHETNADAIHPGYGFLSENYKFVNLTRKNDLIFVGPTAEVMKLLGDKIQSKKLAHKLQVPCVPGITLKPGKDQKEEINKFISGIKLPAIIKAAAGGGGRGIRRLDSIDDLDNQIKSASREALASFGDGRLFIEKLVENARHVEVQIAGDLYGEVIHLLTRDCTLQRQHQKVIEEAPASALGQPLIDSLQNAAVRLCKGAGYSNLGTVEFLVSGDEFFFLEVNSRLQVEHPVTELITGIDLVALQLKIAEGYRLEGLLGKEPVKAKGHAIECRLCAEEPENNFRPASGTLEVFNVEGVTNVKGIRCDTGYVERDTVSHYYDSLLAKLIVHAESRQEAITKMQGALNKLKVFGIPSNIGFLKSLLKSEAFREFRHSIHYATHHLQKTHSAEEALLAGALFILDQGLESTGGPWLNHFAWRIGTGSSATFDISINNQLWKIELQEKFKDTFYVSGASGKRQQELFLENVEKKFETLSFTYNSSDYSVQVHKSLALSWITLPENIYRLCFATPQPLKKDSKARVHERHISSPLPGKVIETNIKEGSQVEAEDVLFVLESMKMEHQIRAPQTGKIETLSVKTGQTVKANDVLAILAG